jgi:hypothetical protein
VFSSIYFLFQIWVFNKKYKNQTQPPLFLYQGIDKKEKVWSKVQEQNNPPCWLQQLIFNLLTHWLKKQEPISLISKYF